MARYIRASDPYHHPTTVHEGITPDGLHDPSLTDFDLTQPSHFGWLSVATAVAQLTARYARTAITKPVVQGEIGYEQLGAWNLQDLQRAAFWLTMLNGAAGHTYGTLETAEAYTADKPLHRTRTSLFTWEEAMNFPGSAQVGLNAKLLQRYPWHRFTPRPEWVAPRGTTLLDPDAEIPHIGIDLIGPYGAAIAKSPVASESDVPTGEWKKRNGTFRQPYAAGIPGEVRIIYAPYFGFGSPGPPTVLGLEPGVLYGAYFWDPTLGIKVDLGKVQRPEPGRVIFQDSARDRQASRWETQTSRSSVGGVDPQVMSLVKGISEANLVAALDTKTDTDTALILRYQDAGNYVIAGYSHRERAIFLRRRSKGEEGPPTGHTAVPVVSANARLSAEVRDGSGSPTRSTPLKNCFLDRRATRLHLAHRLFGFALRGR